MAIKLFDINQKIVLQHNLQDKSFWCKDGEKLEDAFIREFGESIGYKINPDKIFDPYAPDLINMISKDLADLKVQNTPFFKAKDLYGIEPTYAVVFNEKDKIRYEKEYPDLEIIYWVNWVVVKADIHGRLYFVRPLKGVFRALFSDLTQYLKTLRIHYYQQRVNDTLGNAKGSYVLDIRNPIFQKLV